MEPFLITIAIMFTVITCVIFVLYTLKMRDFAKYQYAVVIGILFPFVVLATIGLVCFAGVLKFANKLTGI